MGIDPGLSRCGYAVIEPGRGFKVRAVAIGVITTPPSDPVWMRLGELQRELRALLLEYRPVAVGVEQVFVQQNLHSAVPTAQACGIALAEAHNAGADVALYTPNQVKQAVTGSGRADKSQVTAQVVHLAGLDKPPKPADAADALAVAMCHAAVLPTLGRAAGVSRGLGA